MDKKSGVYIIKNKINKKIYIGSSANILERWCQHKCKLNKESHGNKHLQRAWVKYGKDEFEFIVLELTDKPSKESLLELEQKYLDIYTPFCRDIVYNILETAFSSLGSAHTKETKKKLSLLMKAKWSSKDYRKLMISSFNHKRDNVASAKKISKTRKDKNLSKEKNNPMYGTSCFEIWINKYGIENAVKKQKEANDKNSKLNKGKNNAMFGVKRPAVSDKNKKLKSKKVHLFNYKNNLVSSYKSITEASEKSGFSRSSIKKSLYNKLFIKNHIWKYEK